MARQFWSDKRLAVVLDVCETKASQAYRPALRKMALLFLADPVATMAELYLEAGVIQAQREAGTDAEWENRYRMQTGRGPRPQTVVAEGAR